MSDPIQNSRMIAAFTPLGPNKLLLRSFSYRDALNCPFYLQADLLSKDQNLEFDEILGHPISIRMNLANGKPRFFHGIVAEFSQQDREIGAAVFRALVVPSIWHLKNISDCQIFQNISIPDIVLKVIGKFADVEMKLTESYPPLEFCVQYRESHYNFVARLLERAGIVYHFRHEENRHVLILTDSTSKHEPFPDYETVPYREAEGTHTLIECVGDWTRQKSARSGQYAHNDFDFKRPKADLCAVAPIQRSHGLASFEQFDYPGDYVDGDFGQQLAKVRIEELQSHHEILNGSGSCRGLAVGCTFKLKEHPRTDQNRDYLITGIDLRFDAGGYSSGNGNAQDDAGGETFRCAFTTLPTVHQYRPDRRTPRTLISGPQTAIVTGPSGEEIHTDEHGRVKIHFHWDRHSKFDADASCWVRVSQLWAGKGWGAMHLPRIGQEVIVEFLEGDPDRPIITGRVYNGEAKPPYDLPANKNISTVRSKSTKAGTGFNEIKMDDTISSEMLYIQAEKDCHVLVKNDHVENVQHDETVDIGNDRKKRVVRNEDVAVGGNRTEEVTKNETIIVHENRSEKVDKDEILKIGKNRTHEIGDCDILKVNKKLLVEVGDEITFRAGKSSIVMKKDGTITINGKDINVRGSGSINVKAGNDVVIKGKNVLQN